MSINDVAYPLTYSTTYPVAGINQPSAQFRTNFTILKQAIENLHAKQLIVTGGASGTSAAFGSDALGFTLNITIIKINSGVAVSRPVASAGGVFFNNDSQTFDIASPTIWNSIGLSTAGSRIQGPQALSGGFHNTIGTTSGTSAKIARITSIGGTSGNWWSVNINYNVNSRNNNTGFVVSGDTKFGFGYDGTNTFLSPGTIALSEHIAKNISITSITNAITITESGGVITIRLTSTNSSNINFWLSGNISIASSPTLGQWIVATAPDF